MEISKDEFRTAKVFTVMYPNGCGGKFISNSLGLSADVLFQDFQLAVDQLDGRINNEYKLLYLINKLNRYINETETYWDDLGLGCANLLSVDQFDVNRNNDKTIAMVKDAIQQNKYFTIVAHDRNEEKGILTRWRHTRVIKMYDCHHVFKDTRERKYSKPCVEERFLLDDFPAPHFKWDANWLLNTDETILHLKELYDYLGLTDFNEEYIKEYHKLWLKVTKKLNRIL